jgi:hypothetical protein
MPVTVRHLDVGRRWKSGCPRFRKAMKVVKLIYAIRRLEARTTKVPTDPTEVRWSPKSLPTLQIRLVGGKASRDIAEVLERWDEAHRREPRVRRRREGVVGTPYLRGPVCWAIGTGIDIVDLHGMAASVDFDRFPAVRKGSRGAEIKGAGGTAVGPSH